MEPEVSNSYENVTYPLMSASFSTPQMRFNLKCLTPPVWYGIIAFLHILLLILQQSSSHFNNSGLMVCQLGFDDALSVLVADEPFLWVVGVATTVSVFKSSLHAPTMLIGG